MSAIEEILKSTAKPTEKTALLAAELLKSKAAIEKVIGYFDKAPVAEKGTIMEAIESATRDNPKLIESVCILVVDHLNDKAPRVKWEANRIIANTAKVYPGNIEDVIPKIIENTKDKGTVVRWSAAFALTEIAKCNPKTQKKLIPFFSEIIEKEQNNGVKNIYIKALKTLPK